jgi:phosphate transport system protein
VTETRKQFHDELAAIDDDVVRLGALASEAIEAGTAALLGADLALVEKVVAGDRVLDEVMHSVEQRTFELLGLQQPMAVDLRMLVTVLRVVHEIERVGDLMVKVAKAARRLYPVELPPRVRGLIDRMRAQARAQLDLAVDAFATRDVARASALDDMDDVMDELQKELFQAIFALHAPDDASLQRAVQVALVGRYFERIGDHAATVAERIRFMVTGEFPSPGAGPPSDSFAGSAP